MNQLYEVGKIDKIKVKTSLLDSDEKISINYEDLSRDLKKRFEGYKKELTKKSICLDKYIDPFPDYFLIDREEYMNVISLKNSIIYDRSVDNERYIKYLLQSYNLKKLKGLCRDYELKGYSNLNKGKLIEFIEESLSQEEISDFIKEKELGIISLEVAKGLSIIKKKGKEKIVGIKKINIKLHEIEFEFEGFNWEIKSFLSINKDNIADPERDCDCIAGSGKGFCPHFWVGFIYSLEKEYFFISDWKLTILPRNFKRMISEIKFLANPV